MVRDENVPPFTQQMLTAHLSCARPGAPTMDDGTSHAGGRGMVAGRVARPGSAFAKQRSKGRQMGEV